jgi:molecular chaperone Hsp33
MADSIADQDSLTRFLIAGAGVRGVRVHLDQTWAQIRERADDASGRPPPAAAIELLGEATVASALFTAHAKVEGRLSVQLKGKGALRTLFAECTAAGTLRAIAQLADDDAPMSRDLRELGPEALLAITVENPGSASREPMRYQGLVALQSDSLSEAFEDYFRQSEQLPTRLLLVADGTQAAGLMLQKLPQDGGDEEGWIRAGALFDTLEPRELLDLSAATLLHRLFHEDGVQVLDSRSLRFACSCSRERVEAMLQSLGEAEAMAAATGRGGEAEIRCEFCGQRYCFSVAEVDALFTGSGRPMAAPDRLQ